MTCACFTIFMSCWICHFLSQHWPWPSMSSEEFCGQLWNRVPLILKLAQHHLWWWHSSTSSTSRTGRTSSGGGEHIKSKRTGGRTKGNPGQMPWSTKSEADSSLLSQYNHYSTINLRQTSSTAAEFFGSWDCAGACPVCILQFYFLLFCFLFSERLNRLLFAGVCLVGASGAPRASLTRAHSASTTIPQNTICPYFLSIFHFLNYYS